MTQIVYPTTSYIAIALMAPTVNATTSYIGNALMKPAANATIMAIALMTQIVYPTTSYIAIALIMAPTVNKRYHVPALLLLHLWI